MMCGKTFGFILALPLLSSCGPEVEAGPELDPEETFTIFCEALFACPEADAMATYGSQNGCENNHRTEYERRNETCRELVLVLEDCLAALTCDELVGGGCNDEHLRLGQAGCEPL